MSGNGGNTARSLRSGHRSMAREGFLKDGQRLIATEEVSEDELAGFRIYLEAMREQ